MKLCENKMNQIASIFVLFTPTLAKCCLAKILRFLLCQCWCKKNKYISYTSLIITQPRISTYLKWINKFAKWKRIKNASNLSMRDLMRKSIHALCLSTTLDRHFSMADWRSNLICTSCRVKKVESSCYIQFGMVFTMAIMSLLLVAQSSGINTWFFFSQGWGVLVWHCDNTILSKSGSLECFQIEI